MPDCDWFPDLLEIFFSSRLALDGKKAVKLERTFW